MESLAQGFALAKDRAHGSIRLAFAAVDQDFKRRFQEDDASAGELPSRERVDLVSSAPPPRARTTSRSLRSLATTLASIRRKAGSPSAIEQIGDGRLGLGVVVGDRRR